MSQASYAGAFLGGLLSLFSPCSSLLLPAFFAYAFQSRAQLLGRTFVFLLGLCTFLVPLGMGSALAANLLLGNRELLVVVSGGLLILFGILELAGIQFALLPASLARIGLRAEGSWVAVYSTGLVYGFGGFCAGPLLGSVLTVAAGSGQPLVGAALLFTYAVGMAAPLFLLALLWERWRLGERQALRGRLLRLGPWQIHSFNLIAGLLFIALGVSFIATGGTVGLESLYERIGLLHLSLRLESAVAAATERIPDWLWLGGTALAVGAYLWRRRR